MSTVNEKELELVLKDMNENFVKEIKKFASKDYNKYNDKVPKLASNIAELKKSICPEDNT